MLMQLDKTLLLLIEAFNRNPDICRFVSILSPLDPNELTRVPGGTEWNPESLSRRNSGRAADMDSHDEQRQP